MCRWTRALWTSPALLASTYAIPVPSGRSLPELPAQGVDRDAAWPNPGADHLEWLRLAGADPSTYVFTKTDLQRNLFRIPLH